MSSYLYCFVEKRNEKTGEWENLSLYKKTDDGFKSIEVYGGSASACGDILCGNRALNYPEAISPSRGIPADASSEVKDVYGDGEYYYGATWYDYSELNAYQVAIDNLVKTLLRSVESEYKLEDDDCEHYDETTEYYKEEIENFEYFMEKIDRVLNAYEIWYPKYGQIRVVVWTS